MNNGQPITQEHVAELEALRKEAVLQRETALQELATANLRVAQLKDFLRWGPRSVYSKQVAELMGWSPSV